MRIEFLTKARLIACLAVTQLIGWGAGFDVISVVAKPIADEIGIEHEWLYAGPTLFLILSAITGPSVGRAVKHYGARPILTAGALVMAVGLAGLSAASQWFDYMVAWAVIGLGGALGLGAPAFAAVVERDDVNPKRTVGIVLIFAGLSTAVSWPTFTYLQAWLGWRTSVLIGAAALGCVAAPLLRLGLTDVRTTGAESTRATASPIHLTDRERTLAFLLIATVATLFSVVSFGLSPSLIDIMLASGATAGLALGLASLRSVFGIAARVVDVAFGKKGDAILTAVCAGLLILAGVSILGLFAPHPAAAIAFTVFYGLGSGIATLARAVLPLDFFAPSEFAMLSGRILVPQNLATAFAPLLFSSILDNHGFQSVMLIVAIMLMIALLALMKLSNIRRRSVLRADTLERSSWA